MERTLEIWLIVTSNENEVLEYLHWKIDGFQIDNNLKIKIKFITWNRAYESLIKAYKNDNAPDIIQVGTTWLHTLIHMGYVEKVPDYVNIRESFSENINNICTYNGDHYAAPWIFESIALAARRDYMEELNIKDSDLYTWEGFSQVCREISRKREENPELPKPLSFPLRAESDTLNRFFAMLWAGGWEFPEIDGKPQILTDSKVVEHIAYLADLLQICDISDKERERHPYQLTDDFYIHGKYVFYIGVWQGVIKDIIHRKDESGKGDYRYEILPFPGRSGSITPSFGGGSVLAVSSRSQEKELAWNLVELLISDDFINGWISVADRVPAFAVDFWQEPYRDERIKIMYEQAMKSRTYPAYPSWTTIESILSTGVAQSLWELIDKGSSRIDDKVYNILRKTDESIEELLKCPGR